VCIAVWAAVFKTFSIFIDSRITIQIAGAPVPRPRPTGRQLLIVKSGTQSDMGYLIMKSDHGAVPPSNNIFGFSHQCSTRICHSPLGEQPAYQPAHYHIPGTWFGKAAKPTFGYNILSVLQNFKKCEKHYFGMHSDSCCNSISLSLHSYHSADC
jgi:hypothetical protein